MTDAFKKLFLGLGGDAKELAENNDVGDYIEDLEGAIKAYVDEAAGEGKELPTPAVDDIGKVVSVVSDGESGAEYSLETPASGGLPEVGNLDRSKVLTVLNDTTKEVGWSPSYISVAAFVTNDNGATIQVGNIPQQGREALVTDAIIKPNKYGLDVSIAAADYSWAIAGSLHAMGGKTWDSTAVIFSGILNKNTDNSYYQVIATFGKTSAGDSITVIPLTT